MSRLLVPALLSVCLVSTGCIAPYSAPVVPGYAAVYTNTSAPLDLDADETRLGSKTGRADVTSILGLVSFGDASVSAAAADGNISTIRHVDYEYMSVLGLFSSFTTVVKGD